MALGPLWTSPRGARCSASDVHWFRYRDEARWMHYNKPKAYRLMMPQYIHRALDGYIFSHKGLLMWGSIPSAANAPSFRLWSIT